jgi:hypothetical protein
MKDKELSRRTFLKIGAGGLAVLAGSRCVGSKEGIEPLMVDSALGKRAIDTAGSPVGVTRMDVSQSYSGVGALLQEFINQSAQEAWENIRAKIDYTYANLDLALAPLDAETEFGKEVQSRVAKGQKLLFKPNLVGVVHIDPRNHGPGDASKTNTEWPFMAALMRWFHDKLDISYHQMTLGEASTCMPMAAGLFSMLNPGGSVTTEASIEGRSGDFYGGWGFYFARKYLAESLDPGRSDDPMNGYEESVAGTYLPPGKATDKLMVYDLNRISDDPSKGRTVDVPDGVNYESITLHKAIVGGAPDDPEDREAYPGCILVNVPKFKVHAITLFTNVIKNLGIGLYPMQCAKGGAHQWDYAEPHHPVPGMKGGLPHQVWVAEFDRETGYPKRDGDGKYIVNKTGGIDATMIDVIKAVSHQDITMLHVVDGIEAINFDHTGPGEIVPEGMVFAGVDPVATDLLCARYMFSNVPLEEAAKVDLDDGHGGRFPQKVPLPAVEGNQIVTGTGYDCPLSRDVSFKLAEKRGLGGRRYYVVGRDGVTDAPLASLDGHLGSVADGRFTDLITKTLYYDAFKLPWDMQRTSFNYMDSVDQLTGSSLKKDFLEAFDEDGDGIVTYEEFGKKGVFTPILFHGGRSITMTGTDPFGFLQGPFQSSAMILKNSNAAWNKDGHDLNKELPLWAACMVAFRMSQVEAEFPDPFMPGLTWGKGKWPSFQLAYAGYLGGSIYGDQFPEKIAAESLYGYAFTYADLTQTEGRHTGGQDDPEAINNYISKVADGSEKPLDFTLYVPADFDKRAGAPMPNVESTNDPAKILTATFAGGTETW